MVFVAFAAPRSGFAQIQTAIFYWDTCAVGMERSGDPNGPAPDLPNFSSYTWTCGGNLCIGRTLMNFDLSPLDSGDFIIDARLSLYADPACTYLGYIGQPTYGTFNRSIIRRVTSPWDKNTVTWNNKPQTTKVHQVRLKSSKNTSQNYLDQM
jgi:hypothetical protein